VAVVAVAVIDHRVAIICGRCYFLYPWKLRYRGLKIEIIIIIIKAFSYHSLAMSVLSKQVIIVICIVLCRREHFLLNSA